MNRSNICRTDSSSSNERDRKSDSQINQESPLSDICKYLDVQTNRKTSSRENVELALEVEINESLKEVLDRDSSGSSELLDVTIIRPSESDTTRETTVALNKDEVRDFISLVEQHHKNRKGISSSKNETETKEHKRQDRDVAFEKFPPCESQNSSSKKNYGIQKPETSKNHSKFRYEAEGENAGRSALPNKITNEQKQVYATVNNFDKLKTALSCQNKNKNADQKPGTPCMCQHCGIIGVLVQSQKGPVAAFPPIDEEIASSESPARKPRNCSDRPNSATKSSHLKRSYDLRTKRSINQVELLKEISARIKILEKRISIQEETAVPKEYLKHILQKIMNQYNYRATTRETTTPTTKLKNTGTQYSSKNIPQRETKHSCSHKHHHTPMDTNKSCKGRNYHVHTCLTTSTNPNMFDANKDNKDKPDGLITKKIEKEELKPVQTQASRNNKLPEKENPLKSKQEDLYWLWGEEIVRPGCDLRNKILHLLEDKIHKNNNAMAAENARDNRENTFQYPGYSTKNSPKMNQDGIKIECDNNTIYLKNIDQQTPFNIHDHFKQKETPFNKHEHFKQKETPFNTHEHFKQKETPKPYLINKGTDFSNDVRNKNAEPSKSMAPPPPQSSKWSKFTTLEYPTNRCTYPFDIKKTLDDSTFRKNIEACKEKLKKKPKLQVEEKFFNKYACQSVSTEVQASMDYAAQKIKNSRVIESGLAREKEDFIKAKFRLPANDDVKNSYIKKKLNSTAFRSKAGVPKNEKAINFTYINPKIYNWSEESSKSEDKLLSPRRPNPNIRKEVKCLKKESVIYKLDFLKNLAKNKSEDQSRVLDKIWNQAKTNARSSNDAVFIKIPIKTINRCDQNNNIVEMELTMEELETAVKTAKTPNRNKTSLELAYKSSSDVDIGQRRHQKMRKANREILSRSRRQSSAKSKIQK